MPHKASMLETCISGGKVLYTIVPCLVVYFGLSMEQVVIFVVLWIVDIALGSIVAKIYKGEKITSRKADATLIKKVFKLLIPFIIILAGKGVHLDLTWLGTGIMGYSILTEVYSVLGHGYTLYTGKYHEEEDAYVKTIKFLLKLVGGAKSKVEKNLSDKIDDL